MYVALVVLVFELTGRGTAVALLVAAEMTPRHEMLAHPHLR